MRPDQLVSIKKGGKNYALLFLHLSSGTHPRGMGLRDDMTERAFEFRKALDKAEGGAGKARYLFVGDLNTMGLEYPFGGSIAAEIELRKADRYGNRASIKMRRLAKTHGATWFNGSGSSFPPSDLDHVFATTNLQFRAFAVPGGADPLEVGVRGWVDEATDSKKDNWIQRYSDHALLYFEVHD
jgi:endonuclease/exonuclease/phosphatase family metal-dependent hydrolase